MRRTTFIDEDGWKRQVIIRDDDSEEMAKFGLPAGPPDIRMMDWDSIMREMNNALADAGIFEWNDVQGSRIGVDVAISVVRRYLVQFMRYEARTSKEK